MKVIKGIIDIAKDILDIVKGIIHWNTIKGYVRLDKILGALCGLKDKAVSSTQWIRKDLQVAFIITLCIAVTVLSVNLVGVNDKYSDIKDALAISTTKYLELKDAFRTLSEVPAEVIYVEVPASVSEIPAAPPPEPKPSPQDPFIADYTGYTFSNNITVQTFELKVYQDSGSGYELDFTANLQEGNEVAGFIEWDDPQIVSKGWRVEIKTPAVSRGWNMELGQMRWDFHFDVKVTGDYYIRVITRSELIIAEGSMVISPPSWGEIEF